MYKNVLKSFYSGCIIKIKFMFYEKILEFTGVCIARHMKSRKMVLRIFVVNTAIDYVFFFFSSSFLELDIIKSPKFKVCKNKSFFITGKVDLNYFSLKV